MTAGSLRPFSTLEPADLHASTVLGQPNTNQRPVFCTFCRGTDHFQTQRALAYLYPQPQVRTGAGCRDICKSWNRGACIFSDHCVYCHSCITCQGDHKTRDCPRTSEDSYYKQRKQPPSQSALYLPSVHLLGSDPRAVSHSSLAGFLRTKTLILSPIYTYPSILLPICIKLYVLI